VEIRIIQIILRVRDPWKYEVYQGIDSTQPIETLSIPKYQQYATHQNTKYTKYPQYATRRNTNDIKISRVRNISKYEVYQSINSTQPIEILNIQSIHSTRPVEIRIIKKSQEYETYRNTKYTKVSTVRNPSKYLIYKVSTVRNPSKYEL